MTQREIQENLIRTVRDMLLTSCEKMGAQSIEHCWTRHDGTEVKLILAIHPAGEKEEKPEDELYTYARAAVQKFGIWCVATAFTLVLKITSFPAARTASRSRRSVP